MTDNTDIIELPNDEPLLAMFADGCKDILEQAGLDPDDWEYRHEYEGELLDRWTIDVFDIWHRRTDDQ